MALFGGCHLFARRARMERADESETQESANATSESRTQDRWWMWLQTESFRTRHALGERADVHSSLRVVQRHAGELQPRAFALHAAAELRAVLFLRPVRAKVWPCPVCVSAPSAAARSPRLTCARAERREAVKQLVLSFVPRRRRLRADLVRAHVVPMASQDWLVRCDVRTTASRSRRHLAPS